MASLKQLPRGTVRATLTIILVGVSAALLFVPAVDNGAKEMFLLLTGIAVRDYFAHREAQDRAEGPPIPDAAVNEDS